MDTKEPVIIPEAEQRIRALATSAKTDILASAECLDSSQFTHVRNDE
jgi:hypothetical protein